jgi:hypothetical protein
MIYVLSDTKKRFLGFAGKLMETIVLKLLIPHLTSIINKVSFY